MKSGTGQVGGSRFRKRRLLRTFSKTKLTMPLLPRTTPQLRPAYRSKVTSFTGTRTRDISGSQHESDVTPTARRKEVHR